MKNNKNAFLCVGTYMYNTSGIIINNYGLTANDLIVNVNSRQWYTVIIIVIKIISNIASLNK